MISYLIKQTLLYRNAVLVGALLLTLYGAWVAKTLPIDVFPDLNKPRVTVMTESHGLAPEEVEKLVTIPIENALNGTDGVVGIRSSSGIGISIVYADFEWGSDLIAARQKISERLQQAKAMLPEDTQLALAPITSIMGEIQILSLVDESGKIDAMEMRSIADWLVRPALMGMRGVSQVVVMGGQVKQFQINLQLEKMAKKQLSIEEVHASLEKISLNTTGGVLNEPDRELLIRPKASISTIEEISNTAIAKRFGKVVALNEIAEVRIAAQEKRGVASVDGKPSVVMTIQKHPKADTVQLTAEIERQIADLQKTLPEGVMIRTDLFKQSTFVQHAIANVIEALRDGTFMVAIVLFLFLLNFRTTFITLTAIPISFVITFVIFKMLDLSINTMTLGGLAIAIGELVDDAIVDVENVFRRLRENYNEQKGLHPLRVVYEASKEIRSSLVVSTAMVIVVFIPLFALSGLEGRLFTPMGVAYIVSLLASLLVSVTVTPILCYILLPNAKATHAEKDTFVVSFVKNISQPIVKIAMKTPSLPIVIAALLFIGALFALKNMGRDFLPKFNEGSATIGVATYPGVSLEASNNIGTKIEEAILSVEGVESTVRRTGRAEMDEHAEGVHWSEIDVDFEERVTKNIDEVLTEIRKKILEVADVYVNIGQPISHRIDHMMSGIRSEIAIKIAGHDFLEMRRIAVEIETQLKAISGLVDVQIEQMVNVPNLNIDIMRDEARNLGITPGPLVEKLEMLLAGQKIGQVFENDRRFDISLRLPLEQRNSLEQINDMIVGYKNSGAVTRLKEVADVYETDGPNQVNRENLSRRLVVSANTENRSLSEVVAEIKKTIDTKVKLPSGYQYKIGGKFEAEVAASKRMLILGVLSLLGCILILYSSFKSLTASLIVLANIPLALIGSVAGLYIADLSLSLASLVAFITLTGIASRNGLLLLNHYFYIRDVEKIEDWHHVVLKGTLERLIPVLMTASTGILALIPLLLNRNSPGKEILYPVAVVIVSGLFTSTLFNTVVTPALAIVFKNKLSKTKDEVSEVEILNHSDRSSVC